MPRGASPRGARLLALAALAVTLPAAALAQDFRAWQGAYEGLLIESSEGDPLRAIAWYEGLITGLPADDPSLGTLHFSLGRSLYVAGELDRAREALEQAFSYPEVELRARALLSQIDAQELRVCELPLIEDFDAGTGAWLHSWEHVGKGSVEARPPPGSSDPALAWTTEVHQRQDDQVRLGFDLDALPEQLSLKVRAEAFPAYLMLLAIDDQGRWFTLSDFIVAPTERWVTLDVALSDFVSLPLETAGPEGGGAISGLQALALRDVTAYYSSDQGSNVIYVDAVRVR